MYSLKGTLFMGGLHIHTNRQKIN